MFPTPAGSYYAISKNDSEPARKLLNKLLRQTETPMLTMDKICTWSETKTNDAASELLKHMQSLGWIQAVMTIQKAPKGVLEDILPSLLKPLSAEGKILLAEAEGLCLSAQGFDPDTADELAALSAHLALLVDKHQDLLSRNLHLNNGALALVDAAGNRQIGFWPMHIGINRFVLVIGGLPHLNQPALTQLIWALSIRYAQDS